MVIGKGDGVMREGGRYLYVDSDCAPLRPFHDRIVLGDDSGLVTPFKLYPWIRIDVAIILPNFKTVRRLIDYLIDVPVHFSGALAR